MHSGQGGNKVNRAALLLAIVSCGCISLAGCIKEQPGGRMSQTRLLLDTYCTITIEGADDSGLLDEAFGVCSGLEALMSMTLENSDVWRINRARGQATAVDWQTLEVIGKGIEFGEISGGMFDITIGRLSQLWGFGSERPGIPTVLELEDARRTVDYRQVRRAGNTLQLEDPDAWIDLGGIAKGYIAEKTARSLALRGIEHALIDLGGDIVAVGSRWDGSPWRLGVREPFGDGGRLVGILEVADAAVVSSGTYERQFTENGISYHHILDPNTGFPAKSDVISATVIADDAVTGEGLSTIAVLVGSERIGEIFEQTPGFIGAVLVLEGFEVLTYGEAALAEPG